MCLVVSSHVCHTCVGRYTQVAMVALVAKALGQALVRGRWWVVVVVVVVGNGEVSVVWWRRGA